MTRTDRSFPVGLRVLAASFAFIALAWLGPVAAAREPDQVTQDDVRAAKAKRDQLASDVAAMRAQVAVIAARLSEAAFKVDELEGALEKTKAELAETRARIEAARRKYDRIRARLNERAAEAYIEGPGLEPRVPPRRHLDRRPLRPGRVRRRDRRVGCGAGPRGREPGERSGSGRSGARDPRGTAGRPGGRGA